MDRIYRFHCSQLNNQFTDQVTDFAQYITTMRDIIKRARVDLNGDDQDEKIISANAPFELKPDMPTQKGILLIHGLYDSTFVLRDLGEFFRAQGFLVRAILLPGHGTVPADLLHTTCEDWIKAVNFGVASLKQDVSQVFIAGFSIGGALALHHALNKLDVQGLLLFAPALAVSPIATLAKPLMKSGHLFQQLLWIEKHEDHDTTKYESFTTNSVYQAQRLLKINKRLMKHPLSIPIFACASICDETVITKELIKYFHQLKNPKSRLRIYSNKNIIHNDPRMTIRSSVYPEENIVSFAHTSIPVAPNNPHYGKQGDYQQHLYQQALENNTKQNKSLPIKFGAIKNKNLTGYREVRLLYNPDFDPMTNQIKQFLDSLA